MTQPGPPSVRAHRVVALALPSVVLLDLAAPTHLFGHCGAPLYSYAVAGAQPGPVATSTGLELVAPGGLELLAAADTIVVPGTEDGQPPSAAVRDALRAAGDRGARIMSVCTGAFLLAHAGLLDGRRATTHWALAGRLAEQFPTVTVDPAVLYVDEGQILTSAGVAAGLDLCLHVIRRDHGADVAARIARRTVVAPHRDGGQAQFIRRPLAPASSPPAAIPPRHSGPRGAVTPAGLAATRAWALERLGEPLSVPALARHAGVSPRTFARHFRAETGTTPARWLLDQRVLAARQLLERTSLPVEQIAVRSGFSTPAAMREHFSRQVATTPTAYRRTFRHTP